MLALSGSLVTFGIAWCATSGNRFWLTSYRSPSRDHDGISSTCKYQLPYPRASIVRDTSDKPPEAHSWPPPARPVSRLILVRHAQATLSLDRTRAFDDYDKLSPLGMVQSEALGEELVSAGLIFERTFIGPAARHSQTAEIVGAVYKRCGHRWPEPVIQEGLAEHDGARVVERALLHPNFRDELKELEGLAAEEGSGSKSVQGAFFSVFRSVTRKWARRELPEELVKESWQDFRERVGVSVGEIFEIAQRGATMGVFTSGGPIGSTVASVLGLSDEQALELAWVVQNATLTELLFRDGRASLKSFNVLPRLGSPELSTYV